MYFTHSYAAPVTADCVAATTHGTTFAAAVQRENVWGVQFHPEKSGRAGLRILENFTTLVNEPRTMNPEPEPRTANREPRTCRNAVQTHHRLP